MARGDDENETSGGSSSSKRAERKSRSVLLHGYGGAALRIFGTYTVDDAGNPRKIVVRAYHRDGAGGNWQPGATCKPDSVEAMEDEIADLEMRATALGWKRLGRRMHRDVFTAESLPKPPESPEARMRKKDTFTAGGIPEPLSAKHGGEVGGQGRGRR